MVNYKYLYFISLVFITLTYVSGSSCRRAISNDLLAADDINIRVASSDTLLVSIFNWARETSDGYVGMNSDPVGPWYEAALPGREAFCIRDVSHQSIGAEILWQGKQNLNMFRKFVENISEEKDYCTYWEINRYNKPAPVDYASDDDFWYNLNANFDIIDACYKLYEWTGNTDYLTDPVFDRFFKLTLNEFVERWQLQPERIMDRPAHMNLKPTTVKYRFARGIPSYDEQQDDISVSGDLIGMVYNGFMTYTKILRVTGRAELSIPYEEKAGQYRQLIDSLWWDKENNTYFGFFKKTDGKFYPGGLSNSEFLLWYQVITDPIRIEKSMLELQNSQVEVLSYLPMLFYRYGYNQYAYDFLKRIYYDKRRMYPEASSGAIEGIVRGMAGLEPSASNNMISTCPRLTPKTDWITVENIPVFSGLISLRHESSGKTIFANKSGKGINWRASFQGAFREITVNDKAMPAVQFSDVRGNIHSYVDIKVKAKSQHTAEAHLSIPATQ